MNGLKLGDVFPQVTGYKDPDLCRTKFCRNHRDGYRKNCSTCRKRYWRIINPCKDAFNNLRSNCRRRRKSFELTFDQFEKLCHETGYLDNRGRKALDLSIDRIDPTLGYSIDNIRVITVSENTIKGNRERVVVGNHSIPWEHIDVSQKVDHRKEAVKEKIEGRQGSSFTTNRGSDDDEDLEELPGWLRGQGNGTPTEDPF